MSCTSKVRYCQDLKVEEFRGLLVCRPWLIVDVLLATTLAIFNISCQCSSFGLISHDGFS